MAYESVKKNNTSWSPAHQPARENTFAPRPYTPQPEQEKEATAQPETYSREAYDLISSRMFPTPNPTVQKQPAPQPQAAELEPEQDEQEQEAETTEKLSTPGNPEPPSNNQSNSSEQQPPIQAKLTIGEPGDQYEQEADNVARQVMSMNVTTPSVQRQNEQPETEIDKKPLSFIQRRSLSRTQTAQQTRTQPTVPRENSPFVQRHLLAKTQTHKIIQKSGKSANPATPSLENQLNSKKGSGSPLDGQTRSFMESRFGTDFSSVRVHTDSTAIQMNKDLGAQAFTHGSDIFYGAGKTPGQNELTAHELTHVVQQGGAKTLSQKVQTKSQPETADINKEVRLFPEPTTIAPKQLSETTNYLTNKESHQLHQEIANHHPETPIQTKQLNTQNILQRQPLNISSVSPRIQGNWLAEQAFTKALGSGATQVLSVLKKAGSVFGSIITNPVKFIGNLVTAIRNGFNKFRANIGKHLQNGLAGWLFGALSGAGLVIPAQFDVKGIFSLVLQVLNFTYENVRARLAKKVGGQKVNRLEQSVDVLKKIASGGLVAIWQDIAQYVGNLKDLVIGGIKDWVINTIISQAIAKLISMFTPAGAFIQAVVAIYNTVMFFIERASQIAALANSIFNSIGKIAAGDTGAASNYIEQSMARTLPVMISFLARLIGLGGISQKIKDIIKRIQAPVNKAIDKVVDTIVTKGKAILSGTNNQTQKPQTLGAVGQKPRGSQTQKPTSNNQKPQPTGKPTNQSNRASSASAEQQHSNLVRQGLNKLHQKETKYAGNGGISLQEANKVAAETKKEHPIFKSIKVIDGGKKWKYEYVASPPKQEESKYQKEENSPNGAFAVYRGIHFTNKWSQQDYEAQFEKNLVGQPTFSAAARELAGSKKPDGSDVTQAQLQAAAKKVRERVEATKNARSVKQWWGDKKQIFENLFFAMIQDYVNRYNQFDTELKKAENGQYRDLKFISIPIISTSKHAAHAAKYALGEKGTLKEHQRTTGKLVGRLFIYLFTAKQLVDQGAVNIQDLQKQGKVKIKARIIKEGEIAFTGSIPGENLVAQHNVKPGDTPPGLGTTAENIAKQKAQNLGGLREWES